jgi:UDP-N-acetylmuramyl pentapeptide phosphotransferase/UDP-N-acetylglucosamine-1-phosphate transferase
MPKLQSVGQHQTAGAAVVNALWDVLAGCALGLAATGLSLLLMRALNRIDAPGARHTHSVPTPRGGALGIAVLSTWFVTAHAGRELWLIPAMAGLGLLDDFYPQRAWLRLALQMMLCSVALVSMGDSWQDGPILLTRLTLCVVAVGIVNAANFLDGRNGLLAANAVFLLCALPFLSIHWPLAWPLAGLWLGFLPFNFPRAKLFMGDVGSYLIGGTLAWLMLHSTHRTMTHSIGMLVAMSAILADPALTLLLRISQGKRVFNAHRQHLYQLLARTGTSDMKLLALYLVYAGLSVLVARWIMTNRAPSDVLGFNQHTNVALTLLLWCCGSSALWLLARRFTLRQYRRQQRAQRRASSLELPRAGPPS